MRYRANLTLPQAAERVSAFNRAGARVGPWDVLGVSAESSGRDFVAAYERLCDAEAARLSSADPAERAEAEELILDYTAALMILNAD